MKNKKILFLIFILAAMAVVSGCIKKEPQKPVVNRNVQNVNQNVNANTTNTNDSNGSGVVENGDEEIDTSDWLTYRNEEYGFEVKYPKGWKILDCSETILSKNSSLSISIWHSQNDCNSISARIGIGTCNKNRMDFYEHYDDYKIEYIKINNISAKQVNGFYEIKGGEGEKLISEPKRKTQSTFIPYNHEKDILLSYDEVFYIKNNYNKFEIEEDYSNIYNQIVKSFKFID